MASVIIRYTCGCGFTTYELEAAIKHSDERNHTLTVLGEVRQVKKSAKPGTSEKVPAIFASLPGTDFSALRAKLGKRES